jgi:integrase
MADKNWERLRPFDNPATFEKLVDLPFAIRREIDAGKLTPQRAAEQALAGVGIGILLVAPMRLKNLRQIEIGKHLEIHSDPILLSFRKDEVKNRQPLQFELDSDTAELVRWYLKIYRPRLEGSDTTFLFPSATGGPRTDAGLSVPITKALAKRLGVTLHVHLFRHLAAKLYLDAHPGEYETVRQLLGHKSLTTTMKFYACFSSRTASKLYQAIVTRHRNKEDA